MGKIIYLIRHGESEDNLLPIFQSQASALTKRGRAQACAVARRLTRTKFDAFLSSELVRAVQTSEIIAELTGRAPSILPLLAEYRKPRSIEGAEFTDEAANAIWVKWQESVYSNGIPVEGAEGYNAIIARVDLTLGEFCKLPAPITVVVTHKHFLRTILGRIMIGNNLNGSLLYQIQRSIEVDNCSISTIVFEQDYEKGFRWRVASINDCSHLGDLK